MCGTPPCSIGTPHGVLDGVIVGPAAGCVYNICIVGREDGGGAREIALLRLLISRVLSRTFSIVSFVPALMCFARWV